MKILHIITNLNSGGAEKMLVKLLEGADSKDTHIIITLFPGDFYNEYVRKLGFELIELNVTSPLNFLVKLPNLLNKIIDSDIILTWMYHANLFGLIFSKILRKKIIWNIRRSFVDKKKMKNTTYLILLFNKFFSKRVDGIIYNSYEGKKQHELIGFSNSFSEVIPNGFRKPIVNKDITGKLKETLNITEGDLIFCNIARWEPLKDHHNLLKALNLVKKHLNFKILLVGKNIDENNSELLRLVNKYNLRDNVILLAERRDIKEIMAISDLYINSSISEGFPNVLGEAMYSNLLVVSTDSGDSSYILQDAKLIVPVSNPELLAEKILEISTLSDAEKSYLKKFLIGRVQNNYIIENITKKYFYFLRSRL